MYGRMSKSACVCSLETETVDNVFSITPDLPYCNRASHWCQSSLFWGVWLANLPQGCTAPTSHALVHWVNERATIPTQLSCGSWGSFPHACPLCLTHCTISPALLCVLKCNYMSGHVVQWYNTSLGSILVSKIKSNSRWKHSSAKVANLWAIITYERSIFKSIFALCYILRIHNKD